MKINEILDELKIQTSKNGVVAGNAITHLLKLKNMPNHMKLVRENKENLYLNITSSPYEYLLKTVAQHPRILKEIAIIEDRNITYVEFLKEINSVAQYLHFILQSKKGENISICAAGSINGIVAFFAMNKLGLVNARVFNGAKAQKMESSINDFESETIFIDKGNLTTLKKIIKNTKIKNIIVMDSIESDVLASFKSEFPKINIVDWKTCLEFGNNESKEYQESTNYEDTASILYTSGSSGEAKPITTPNRVYVKMVDVVAKTTDIKKCDGEKVIGVVSHEYPYSAINSTIMILLMGKTLILPNHNNNKSLDFDELFNYEPDRIQAIPNLYKLLESQSSTGKINITQLGSLNSVISGGERYLNNDKKKWLRFARKMKCNALLIDGFGFGELGSATALKFGLCEYFLLMNGIEVKAINPETMEELDIDEEGILCFTGPTITDGYYKNNESTSKAFIKNNDGKVWFISDTYGSVHGKMKRLFKLGGRIREYFITSDGNGSFVKVYAGSVEDTISSLGFIEDCVIVPSNDGAEPTPKAYISLRTDCNLSKEEIEDFVHERCSSLENFSQPTEIVIEEKIKRTPAGKKDYTYYKGLNLNSKR